MVEEIWKPIPGYGGKYYASSLGRIKNKKTDRILKKHIAMDGYCVVSPNQKTKRVHVLVLETFVGPRPKGLDTAHLNGQRDDNRLENLIWCSRKENMSHKVFHGTSNRGEKCGAAKFTNLAMLSMKQKRSEGWSYYKLDQYFSCSTGTSRDVCLYRPWIN